MAEETAAEAPATEPAAASSSVTADEVEIKFVIVPEGFSHTRRFAPSLTLHEMKKHVEEDLRIPVSNMKLMYNGHEMLQPLLTDYPFSKDQPNQVHSTRRLSAGRPPPATSALPAPPSSRRASRPLPPRTSPVVSLGLTRRLLSLGLNLPLTGARLPTGRLPLCARAVRSSFRSCTSRSTRRHRRT